MGDDATRDLIHEVSELRGDVRALTARIDVQLVHGAKKMDDLEARMRVLEQARWRAAGMVSALGALSGGGAATLVTYVLSHH